MYAQEVNCSGGPSEFLGPITMGESILENTRPFYHFYSIYSCGTGWVHNGLDFPSPFLYKAIKLIVEWYVDHSFPRIGIRNRFALLA